MKKITALALALCLALCLVPAASAAGSIYHSGADYLADTLTLAGNAFEGTRTLTVAAVEAAARDESSGLFYENEYSMMTSGGVFSKHVFTGVRIYELMLSEGLDLSAPDSTPVKFISKDGYTIPMTLGEVRGGRNRYSARGGELEETGLPAIAAFASDGEALVGPVGRQSVYTQFDEESGYIEAADNVGGPLRLIIGQDSEWEFNAPSCSKWLAAIVVGDAGGYVYSRGTDAALDTSEPDRTGDWTHKGAQADYRLKITGSEASAEAYLSLAEIEAMPAIREYYAASAGRNAYEGTALKTLVSLYLKPGIAAPAKVTVRAADGYEKAIDPSALINGMESFYQPGKHRDLLLAWAVDGSPLVESEQSEGYDGANAFGPIRLVAENTISMWVKNVSEIIIGDEIPFSDVKPGDEYCAEICALHSRGIINGVGGGNYSPASPLTRAQAAALLCRAFGSPAGGYSPLFADVKESAWYAPCVLWAAENGCIAPAGEGIFAPDSPISPADWAAALSSLAECEVSAGGGETITRAAAAAALERVLNGG